MSKRWINVFTLFTMLAGFLVLPAQPAPAATLYEPFRTVAAEDSVATPAVTAAPSEPQELFAKGFVNVRVTAPEESDLSKFGQFFPRRIPDPFTGMTVYYGRVAEKVLPSLQAYKGVQDVVIVEKHVEPPVGRPDPAVDPKDLPSMEETRARLIELRDNPPEPQTPPAPEGWWDVAAGGHNAVEAWEAGYTGEGAKVAVVDSGVDMAHPDFWGTEARYENVSGEPYYDYFDGWPLALSPLSNYFMAYDWLYNGELTDLNTFAYGLSMFADTRTTGTGSTVSFSGNVYTTTGTADPRNPVYHIGYHPDWSLENYAWGERIGVLVVDEDGDDVYDTVYVDLNNNKDFRDDKPARKDSNPADNYREGAEELSWWDADLDGYPDVSGGMLHFIADGEHCPPFFDVYFGCDGAPSDGIYPPPGNGDVVAFMFVNLYDTDHGQLCASNVVGQGNINGDAPAWKPDAMGGMVQGMGRDAKLVPVGDVYFAFQQSTEQAWWFQALGYDGWLTLPDDQGIIAVGDDDSLQASSNSYGDTYIFEGGWDEWSRVMTYLNAFVNPYTTFFLSSGNVPLYGTATTPAGVTAIQVGASTEYGSAGYFESIASLEQMTSGDTTSWSTRGPSRHNQLVPHLTGNGSYGTGALGLNEWFDGWTAWDLWGGTSRSGPAAMGASTLVMDAFYEANGRWPTWYEVRGLMMQGAEHINYDPMTGGTGYVNAGRSAKIAGGHYGITITPDYWDVGDFEGQRFPGGFAHITEPGMTYTTDVTLTNTSALTAATVSVSDYVLEPIETYERTWTAGLFDDGGPEYLFNLTELAGGEVPDDTVFIVAQLLHSFDTFDPDGDEVIENRFSLYSYEWTDINGDGNLWEDDGNGVVEEDEIDPTEYARINYSVNYGPYQEITIGNPLTRFNEDGIFFGVNHSMMTSLVPETELTLRVTLYRRADWGALDSSVFADPLILNGGDTLAATVTFTAPMEYGFYQGALAFDVMADSGESYQTIVPVFTQVAYSGDLTTETAPVTLGDVTDEDALYTNGSVRPMMDWIYGRGNAGDWRFFFFNQDVVPSVAGQQTKLVARTTWEGETPPTDLDTFLLGPDFHFSSYNSGGTNPVFGASYAVPGDFWGPYSQKIIGASESPQLEGGHWAFAPDTGGAVDYTVGDFNKGLHSVQIHPTRLDGSTFDVDFEVELGYVSAPEFLEWDNYATERVTLTTNLTFTEGVAVRAFGLESQTIANMPGEFVPGPASTAGPCAATYIYTFTVGSVAQLEVAIDNFVDDLDLFVLHDFNGNGNLDCGTELIGYSASLDIPEVAVLENPPAGTYWVAVLPYSLSDPAGESFDLSIESLVYGASVSVANVDGTTFGPGDDLSFDVFNEPGSCDDESRSCLNGWVEVLLDTDNQVSLFRIPVTPRYNQVDLSQSSLKWVDEWHAIPGDVLTYTIELVNTATADGYATVTDTLPANVTLVRATPGYSMLPGNVIVWEDVPVPAGGGQVMTAEYDWVDISGMGTEIYSYDFWLNDDAGLAPLALPFFYPFFGDSYDDLWIDPNGEVIFVDDTDSASFFAYFNSEGWADGAVPGPDYGFPYDNRIAVLFGDQAGAGSSVLTHFSNPALYTYYDDANDRYIIQWDEWQLGIASVDPFFCGVGFGSFPFPDNTYQLILYEDGRAKAQYAEITTLPALLSTCQLGDPGVEGPQIPLTTFTGAISYLLEGYPWPQVPESGTAWEYDPQPADTTVLTAAVRVQAGLEDTVLCNFATLDNHYGQLTGLEDCTRVGRAELDVVKNVDTGNVYADQTFAGDTITFTLSVYNDGPLDTQIDVTDVLSEGLRFSAFVAPDEGFAVADDERTVLGTAVVNAGDTFELIYTAVVESSAYWDELCNYAMVENNFGTAYTAQACVMAQYSDVSVDKSHSFDTPGAWPGSTVTYVIELENNALVETDVTLTDMLPDGLTFGQIVGPVSASYAGGMVSASFTIDAFATEYVTFTATIDAGLVDGTSITNTATVTDTLAGYTVSDTDTFYLENANFSTSYKEATVSQAMPGDRFYFNVYVVNSGTFTDTATVTDTLPAEVMLVSEWLPPELSYDEATHTVSWSGEVGAAGAFVMEIPVEVKRIPSMVIGNEGAWITGGDTVFVTDPAFVEINSAELALDKWIGFDDPYDDPDAGYQMGYEMQIPWDDAFDYVIEVENTGTISTMVSFSDPVPAGLVVDEDMLGASLTFVAATNTVMWDGVLGAGETISFAIPVVGTLAAAQQDKELFNSAMAYDEWGNGYESNTTRVRLASTELGVLKYAIPAVVMPGDVISYTIVIRNTGDQGTGLFGWLEYGGGAWEAQMIDNLPEYTTFIPGSLEMVKYPDYWTPPSCTLLAQDVVCDFNLIPPDLDDPVFNEIILRYAVEVAQNVAPGAQLVNFVSVDDGLGVMTYAWARVDVPGVPAPVLEVSPMSLMASSQMDEMVTKTLMISNIGTADLDWTLAEMPAVDWLDVSLSSGTLISDTSADVDVFFDAAGLTPGTYTTTLRVEDAAAGLQADVDVVYVVTATPEIAVSPQSFAETLMPGKSVTRTLMISNPGMGALEWSLMEQPAVDWLAAWPVSGTLAANTNTMVDIPFNATGLMTGTYTTTLHIQSDAEDVLVPVSLEVTLVPPTYEIYLPLILQATEE